MAVYTELTKQQIRDMLSAYELGVLLLVVTATSTAAGLAGG